MMSACRLNVNNNNNDNIYNNRSSSVMSGGGGRLQYGRVKLERGQHVLLVSDVHAAVPPRVGQLQRFEVVAQTPFPGPGHRHQTEVAELRARVDRARLALDHHRHVQLLQEQLHHFAGRRRRTDVQLQAGRMRQTGVVGGAHLRTHANRRCRYFYTLRYDVRE